MRIVSAIADLRREADGGIASRFFQAYGRLVRAHGREVSAVKPARQLNGRLLIAFTGTLKHSRIALAEELIQLVKHDAGLADSIAKGLALSEADFCRRCAVYAREELHLAMTADSAEADLVERVNAIGNVADARDKEREYFLALAEGRGWA